MSRYLSKNTIRPAECFYVFTSFSNDFIFVCLSTDSKHHISTWLEVKNSLVSCFKRFQWKSVLRFRICSSALLYSKTIGQIGFLLTRSKFLEELLCDFTSVRKHIVPTKRPVRDDKSPVVTFQKCGSVVHRVLEKACIFKTCSVLYICQQIFSVT